MKNREMEPPSTLLVVEEESTKQKPIYLFGRNILEIKCFRSSFICGICCGVVGGLACFLGTSKALFSTHIGFTSLWIGVFGYWFPCRYKYENEQFLIQQSKVLKQNSVKVEHFKNEDSKS